MKKTMYLYLLLLLRPGNFLYGTIDDIKYAHEIRTIIADDDRRELRHASFEPQASVCVSLGFNCTVALELKRNNLRAWSFPFDWTITSLQGTCDLIADGFVDLFNPLYLERSFGLFNRKYKIALMHDVPVKDRGDGLFAAVENYPDLLDPVKIRYQRRIDRFYNICNMADTVYFFRLGFTYWKFDAPGQSRESVIALRNSLMKAFPNGNWVLVVIDTSPDYHHNWGIDHVKNFYISDHGRSNEWTDIFRKLGLLS